MASFGFCGQSYLTQTPIAGAQRTINRYPEQIQDTNEPYKIILLPTPGLATFADVVTGPVRGMLRTKDGNLYVVGRGNVYSITSGGVVTSLGMVANTNNNAPVAMAASDTQLMIIADGLGYYVTL